MYQDYVSEKDRTFAREFEKFLSRSLAEFGRVSKLSLLSLAQTFVNGQMYSAEATGREMTNAHRYLQQEMFKVCLAFVGQLAKNYQRGYYDERNEWASRLAAEAYEHLAKEGLVYDPEFKKVVIIF